MTITLSLVPRNPNNIDSWMWSSSLKYFKIYYCDLVGFGQGQTKCRQFAICNLQFCKVPALSLPYETGWAVKFTCQYDPDFQGVRISHATLESIHLNQSINCKEKIKNLYNECI